MAYTTINKSSSFMNSKIYTGDGNSTQAITGVGHQPDLVWLKNRSDSTWHQLIDAVRGTGAAYTLASNSNEAEGGGSTNQYGFISALSSDGFTVSAGSSNASVVNQNGQNYVAWNWKANGAGSANTDGSLSSSVSANQTSGFSIVTYNGRDATDTIGHGLGAEPSVILFKCTSNTGSDWYSYWEPLGNNSTIRLNTTDASSSPTGLWNTTNPTSSVFTVTSSDVINRVGRTFVAYCFAEKQGFSKFGSYTGNGSTDGTFVYTGFKPAWLLLKQTNVSGESWYILDTKRNTFNPCGKRLRPNSSSAEEDQTNNYTDILSNGFKLRTTDGRLNASGGTYIYMAIGQSLVGTNNIPNNAR